MTRSRSLVWRWVAAGAVLGLTFAVAGILVGYAIDGFVSIVTVHTNHPVLFAMDAMPVVLGGVGLIIGLGHQHIAELHATTEDIAERMAHELDAEIHDHNVEVAHTAQLQTKYFAALSHDMRTPLSAILGFSEAALDDGVEVDQRTLVTYMEEIATCSRQLLDIVNDLMDAAKLGSGRVELQVSDVDGDELAAEVGRHLAPLAEEQGLVLFTDLTAEDSVRADSKRMRQILVNLVSNAIKYTDEGSVLLRSAVVGDQVHYEVVDTGAGISKDDMPVLFRLFEQTDIGKHRIDSTGFGLPVSLGLAEAMGGTIEVESDGPGFGSLFRLVLQRGSGAEEELFLASLPAIAA